ncbi:GNAT family N-acetyltransferase [Paenibacillus pedocola]|uniref:GNAT family N-acetyltransferase n=1 Tax=Paenibacillus pedocola TaxID=3242193 RepID=UPI00287750D4|nr:GNAT family N-acetyltransferase [Paenibacillus typhae]
MHMKLTISRLTPEDKEAATRIFEISITDAFEQEGLGDLYEDIQNEIEWKNKLVLSSLSGDNPDNFFMLAKLDGTAAGTISFGPCGEDIRGCTGGELNDTGELGSLYVLPQFQGQGVGSALIKSMAAWLRRQGIQQFCLDSGYKRAQQRWLRKFGVPYKTVQHYWGRGNDHMIWLCKVKDFTETAE